MDCREAQEQILESLDISAAGLQDHLSGCAACRRFADAQTTLDLQLSAAISAPPLSPAFRASLMKKVRREPLAVWPDFLPDIAHLAGCVGATALCLALLPFPARNVMLAGLGFTLVTYFAQSVIRGSLESSEED